MADSGKHDDASADQVSRQISSAESVESKHYDSPPRSPPAEEEYEYEYDASIKTEERPQLEHQISHASTESKTVVFFQDGDPENPYNWSKRKKAAIVIASILTVFNSTIGSSIPSGDISQLFDHYNISGEGYAPLPNSIYLIGYVVGPLFFSPLSERYGRQIILLSTFAGFTIWTLAVCFAPNWAAFNIFRLIIGIFASTPMSVIGGLYADLYATPRGRGGAMAAFMTSTIWGPCAGPVASGYLGVYSWRWPFWFALIFAGVTWIPFAFLPETFGPTILERRAKRIRKENPGCNVFAPIELDSNKNFRLELMKHLRRPFRMLFTEPIVSLSCLYLALIYAVFYLFLQAFPIIYPPIYGFSLGEEGLTFLPIGVGALFACMIYLYWEHRLAKAKEAGKEWASREEYRRLPIACLGGPFFAISLFWIGWTARESVHWAVPVVGGIPFGVGYLLLFNAFINYLVDAYEIYGASALAASTCSRSLLGAALPFAAKPMYDDLGVAWACSTIGFISIVMCFIPFMFIKYGPRIRAGSKFCQELQAEKQKRSERDARRRARAEKKQGMSEKAEDKV